MNDHDPPGRPLETLEGFLSEVDRRTGPLETQHADRLRCGLGCSDCCVDDLTVFDVEAERIRRAYPRLLREESPHPAGDVLEYRDICPLNELADQPIEAIADDGCWTIGPPEHELATIQRSRTGDGQRIKLRDLFNEKR